MEKLIASTTIFRTYKHYKIYKPKIIQMKDGKLSSYELDEEYRDKDDAKQSAIDHVNSLKGVTS